MATYEVKLVVTKTYYEKVEADSEEHALEKAYDLYDNDEIGSPNCEYDYDDHLDVNLIDADYRSY